MGSGLCVWGVGGVCGGRGGGVCGGEWVDGAAKEPHKT